MESVILVIHLFLALAIIGLVLLQRSEGGGLGIGGGSGGLGGLATPEGTANLLTRATAFCAAGFFCTSLILGILAGQRSAPVGLMDALEETPAAVEMQVPTDKEGTLPDGANKNAETVPASVPMDAPEAPPEVPIVE